MVLPVRVNGTVPLGLSDDFTAECHGHDQPHDGAITWKRFPHYSSFVGWSGDSPFKGLVMRNFDMSAMWSTWTRFWDIRVAGDLRSHDADLTPLNCNEGKLHCRTPRIWKNSGSADVFSVLFISKRWEISLINYASNYWHLPVDEGRLLPANKVHRANMVPIWGRQDPVGPHVGPMNLVIWVLPDKPGGCRRQISRGVLVTVSETMITSSNGNIFRVTGPLCGEFTCHRWIPHTKASDAELWCFLWSASE